MFKTHFSESILRDSIYSMGLALCNKANKHFNDYGEYLQIDISLQISELRLQ